MIRVASFDVGKSIGFALLDVEKNGTATLLKREVYSDPASAWRYGFEQWPGIDLVVIEAPSGIVFPGRQHGAQHMIAAARIGGILEGFARGRVPVVVCTANEWRKALGCLGTKAENGDHAVKRAVRQRIANWPKVSADHERDAAGAGIFGAMKWAAEARKTA